MMTERALKLNIDQRDWAYTVDLNWHNSLAHIANGATRAGSKKKLFYQIHRIFMRKSFTDDDVMLKSTALTGYAWRGTERVKSYLKLMKFWSFKKKFNPSSSRHKWLRMNWSAATVSLLCEMRNGKRWTFSSLFFSFSSGGDEKWLNWEFSTFSFCFHFAAEFSCRAADTE